MTFRPWRIITWQYKLLYVVVALFASFGVLSSVLLLKPNPVFQDLLAVVLGAFVFFWGVRAFRGTNEDYFAPRAWWRMTSRPPLSRALGTLGIVFAVLSTGGLVGGLLGLTELVDPFGQVLSALACATLASLYLTSARRQAREQE